MAIWTSTVPRTLMKLILPADVECSAQWPGLLERLIPRLDLVMLLKSGLGNSGPLIELQRLFTTCFQFHRYHFPNPLYILPEMDDPAIFPVKIRRRKLHRKKTSSSRPHRRGNPLDYDTSPCPPLPSARRSIQALLDPPALFRRNFSPCFLSSSQR